jgi:hypothetical protein
VIALFLDGLAYARKYKIKPYLVQKITFLLQNLSNNPPYKLIMEELFAKLAEGERKEVL